MSHQLPRFGASCTKAHAIYNVVQTLFQQGQQIFTGVAFETSRIFIVVAELLLKDAVDTTYFLLFTQLNTVVGQTTATLTVLAGRAFVTTFGF